jgi:sugar phosphate isomerase/epimerase
LDYLGFINSYGEQIKAFHVKDAEFNPNARSGVYGGYLGWKERPGRFRSLGDGQVDFRGVFSRLTQVGYDSWAVMEWECCLKSAEQGAREGAPFIRSLLIETADRAFDDFAGTNVEPRRLRQIMGLD